MSNSAPRILIIGDVPRTSTPEVFGFFSSWQWEFYRNKLLRAGISPEEVQFLRLEQAEKIRKSKANLIVSLGERPLCELTGKKSIEKWHMSPLESLIEYGSRKVIPTFDQQRVQQDWSIAVFVEMAFLRAAKFSKNSAPFVRQAENFHLNPPIEEAIEIVYELKGMEVPLGVDIETGRGQINTIGFAWSPSDAVAINVLPGNYGPENYMRLWTHIADLINDPKTPKVYQNFIYDTQWLSMYGIETRGIYWDTMLGQKFLWPEFKSNLGVIGRIYTERSYWKDDGRVEHEEVGRKDWGNIRDWPKHYAYNCRDTSGTLEAHLGQKEDLIKRNLLEPFEKLVLSLIPPVLEMTTQGLPFSEERRSKAREEVEGRLGVLLKDWHKYCDSDTINPGSPAQLTSFLKERKFKIPKIYDSKVKSYRESVGIPAIKKLRLKHPEEKIFDILIQMSRLRKSKNSYINFPDRGDSRIYFSLNAHGTETGRMSGGKDSFGFGINTQTNPTGRKGFNFKQMIEALPGCEFIEVDLRQAESRFVAYDSADLNLIRMLEDPKIDLHKYVAGKIFNIQESNITKDQRELGKKAGHGANYNMKAGVFVETCLNEMDLVLSKKEAEHILATYYAEFPGIPRWHAEIRKILREQRRLSTPLGRERFFYGRLDDAMNREGYAYKPQSTIPDITNLMMLHALRWRDKKKAPVSLLLQVHDSLIFHAERSATSDLVDLLSRTEPWHPEIVLPGGRLIIPTEVKTGRILSELTKVN